MIAILYSNTKLVWSLTISDDLYSIEKIKKRKNSDLMITRFILFNPKGKKGFC